EVTVGIDSNHAHPELGRGRDQPDIAAGGDRHVLTRGPGDVEQSAPQHRPREHAAGCTAVASDGVTVVARLAERGLDDPVTAGGDHTGVAALVVVDVVAVVALLVGPDDSVAAAETGLVAVAVALALAVSVSVSVSVALLVAVSLLVAVALTLAGRQARGILAGGALGSTRAVARLGLASEHDASGEGGDERK